MPPADLAAEASLIGAVLLENAAWGRVAGLVAIDDLFNRGHRQTWQAIADLIEAGKPADAITVAETLEARGQLSEAGGLGYIVQVIQGTPSAANVLSYAGIVRERADRRRLAALALKLADAANAGQPVAELAAKAGEELTRASAGRASAWPLPLDLPALAATDPEPPRFVIPGWLPAGYATLISGHGGLGKSGIILALAVCVAAGAPFYGLQTERRRVLLLSCEDRAAVLHWRLHRIAAHMGIDLAALGGWLDIRDLVGRPAILWTPEATTPAFAELAATIRTTGTEILIVDGIADAFAGNENSRSDVKAFVGTLLGLVPPDNGAVILIGHVNRTTAGGGSTSQGYSGSTGWNNAVRARWFLSAETTAASDDGGPDRTGALLLELQKSNLGPTAGVLRFVWDEDAGMFVGSLEQSESTFDRRNRDQEEQDGVMRALAAASDPVPAAQSGQRTAFHVLSVRPEFPASLLAGNAARRRFWRHLEALRAMGKIEERAIRRADRHLVRVLAATGKACGHAGND
jgi:archaellum biogenesis ATPase FlaH